MNPERRRTSTTASTCCSEHPLPSKALLRVVPNSEIPRADQGPSGMGGSGIAHGRTTRVPKAVDCEDFGASNIAAAASNAVSELRFMPGLPRHCWEGSVFLRGQLLDARMK